MGTSIARRLGLLIATALSLTISFSWCSPASDAERETGQVTMADTAGVFYAVPATGTPANIVVPSSLTPGGLNATQLAAKTYYDVYSTSNPDEIALWRAIHYLQEGIFKMTGKTLNVVSSSDLSTGIVLTTMAAATPDIVTLVGNTLALNGTENDAALEAYSISTFSNRTVVAANTYDGLAHAAVELLLADHAATGFGIGYEVLGMGPDWTYTPDYHGIALGFSETYVGRPGFLVRDLYVVSGQERGQGTIYTISPLAAPTDDHPADEPVQDSYNRWMVGTQMTGSSTPPFPGHAMQAFHKPVIIQMVASYSGGGAPQAASGFLSPTLVGPHVARPAATSNNAGTIWIETDTPTAPSVFISQSSSWVVQSLSEIGSKLDVSVPMVRNVVLNGVSVPGYSFTGMTANARAFFGGSPNSYYVVPTDMEDGGLDDAQFTSVCFDKNWWPTYRVANGLTVGAYALGGTAYAPVPNQTTETWWSSTTPADVNNAQTDSIFAFDAWLLHEYDKYIGALPPGNDTVVNGIVTVERQNTSTGGSKKSRIRTEFQSYGSHDVPPNFNPDPRTRVMVAGFPVHRGLGKWVNLKTGLDVAAALAIALPNQPGSAYTILSSPLTDANPSTIGASHIASFDQLTIKGYYDRGIRALTGELNFGFGKRGLDYYMLAKMLWDPTMTGTALDGIRTRWLQRAFGPGAAAMKNYYDALAPESAPYNGPTFWAKAMAYIDQAETAINNPTSPYQERLDDVKQYWYFYYLQDVTAPPASASNAFKEFVWKGQMSYQTTMYMVTHYFWSNYTAEADATPAYAGHSGAAPYLRAHYTHAEAEAWWALVKAHWPVTNPHLFKDLVMDNGQPGSTVDLNDLTPIVQFQPSVPASYNVLPTAPLPPLVSVETVARNAGDTIGYQMFWSDATQTTTASYYGVSWYNTVTKAWQSVVDFGLGTQASVPATEKRGSSTRPDELVRVAYPAPQAGTYRFDIQPTGWSPSIVSLDYDLSQAGTTQAYPTFTEPFTYTNPMDVYYGAGAAFYVPKKTQYLDFEIPAYSGTLTYVFVLYTGLPGSGMAATRSVSVTPGSGGWKIGYNSIPLKANEAGSFGAVYCTGGASQYQKMPYLYSVPMLYSFNQRQLAMPRALAAADGLAPLTSQHLFADLPMANGQLGSTVDLNDVSGIAQFQTGAPNPYYTLNAMPSVVSVDTVAKNAGDTIGFQMFWSDPNQTPTTAHYGISSYNASTKVWQSVTDFPLASQASVAAVERRGVGITRPDDLVKVSYVAPQAGTYRFDIQPAGWSPGIVSLDFDLTQAGTAQAYPSFTRTFSHNAPMDIWYGGGHVFYVPKNVHYLDFEIPSYSPTLNYVFLFYTGLPTTGMTATRSVTVTPGSGGWVFGYNSIPLNANEAGSLAVVYCTGGASQYQKMPYLDSVPMRYSFNEQQLALPRNLATADGLTLQ